MTIDPELPYATVLDHVRIPVRDCALSRRFYDAALAPLGIHRIADRELDDGHSACGYGRDGQPAAFWLSSLGISRGYARVAFRASSHEEVRAFYRAALAGGGRDHGPPALYPARHPRYFAACVYDPDGYTVEAVTHAPESDGAA